LGLQILKHISNSLLLDWTMLGCFGYLDGKRKLKDIAAIQRCLYVMGMEPFNYCFEGKVQNKQRVNFQRKKHL